MNTHVPDVAAVLWDMDGTLIDSEPYWIDAETELARRYGVEWTAADGLSLVGNPLEVSGAVLQQRGVDLPVDQIVELLLTRVTEQVIDRMPWQPDARALLDAMVSADVPCALVTMSYPVLARPLLDSMPGVFRVVVTGDEVTHGKPHPEPYLTAATRLGVDVTKCVAIEDSPVGVASALASGAATVAVRRIKPIEARPGLSRVRSLRALSVASLGELVGGTVIDELGDDT